MLPNHSLRRQSAVAAFSQSFQAALLHSPFSADPQRPRPGGYFYRLPNPAPALGLFHKMPVRLLPPCPRKTLRCRYRYALHYCGHLQLPAAQFPRRIPCAHFLQGITKSFRYRSTNPTPFHFRSVPHIQVPLHTAFPSASDLPERKTAVKSDILHRR